MSKVIPATARNGLLEDSPTGKVEPEKKLKEDRYNEEGIPSALVHVVFCDLVPLLLWF